MRTEQYRPLMTFIQDCAGTAPFGSATQWVGLITALVGLADALSEAVTEDNQVWYLRSGVLPAACALLAADCAADRAERHTDQPSEAELLAYVTKRLGPPPAAFLTEYLTRFYCYDKA